jgi:hypothetical protein
MKSLNLATSPKIKKDPMKKPEKKLTWKIHAHEKPNS